eukprot:14233161-Ditylum_brightwellii.AAC.1
MKAAAKTKAANVRHKIIRRQKKIELLKNRIDAQEDERCQQVCRLNDKSANIKEHMQCQITKMKQLMKETMQVA